jgi:succinate dehydrogenase / fumarate reductase flavoprotein subunit
LNVYTNNGTHSVDYFHKKLGKIMWNKVGMANAKGLTEAIEEIAALREEFYKDVKVPGDANSFNQELDKAGRVADFLELGELFAKDALHRVNLVVDTSVRSTNLKMVKHNEMMKILLTLLLGSTLVSEAVLHKEPLVYENVKLVTRSYK